MDQDSAISRDTSQEEDRFWIDTERQYFSSPNPTLLLCLRNHAWHCRYIARESRKLLNTIDGASSGHSGAARSKKSSKTHSSGKSGASNNVKNPGPGATQDGSCPEENGIISVSIGVKNKSMIMTPHGTNAIPSRLPFATGIVTGDHPSYAEDRSFYLSRTQTPGTVDDDLYYNPVVSAKHDSKLRLPMILPSQAPDGIRLLIYCPEEPGRETDPDAPRKPGYKTGMLTDILNPDHIPEILHGPSPVWSRVFQPIFKTGRDISPFYEKSSPLLEDIRGPVVDPVWESHNDFDLSTRASRAPMLCSLGFTEVLPQCTIDYSPKLFTFVEAKAGQICKRCLGMPKVSCPLCMTGDQGNNIPGVCFSNHGSIYNRFELVFNKLDIYKARSDMGMQSYLNPYNAIADSLVPLKRSTDDDITAVIREYVTTLEEIDVAFSSIIERVEAEKKPNFDYWSDIESQMVSSYIEQYNNKMMDNRYNYSTQRQSIDVLRIRITCSKSSTLPVQWTDHALCSVCGSDEDWDDDPILFCDCCYIPMHYCCLGFTPGTMSETIRQNVRRHKLLHTKEDDEPNIDEDEWICPSCLFLLDQLAFLDENMALKAIRIAAGPRNKQMLDMLSGSPIADVSQPLEEARLPYIVGFRYDSPIERIDLCTLYRRTPLSVHLLPSNPPTEKVPNDPADDKRNESVPNDPKKQPKIECLRSRKLTFGALMDYGNIPTTVAITLPGEDIQSPFDYDLSGFEMDLLGRTITQFWSFKGMTQAQLEIARDIFDENLVRYMTDGNLDGMLKLFMYMPKEEENTHHAINQDRAFQRQKAVPQKRGRKPAEFKSERLAQLASSSSITSNPEVRHADEDINPEDMYSFNCKNGLKKLVISVRMARNFFVNVKLPVCILCGFDAYYPGGGPMKRTSKPGTWAHVRCAISMDCTITPQHVDFESFVPKVKALRCLVCHHLSTAIVQCSHGSCCKAFHVTCAASSSNCLFTWDQGGRPDILCPQHASGLAPTVLLRKLQTKIQYKNFKKLSGHETSLDYVNPKDDVFVTHLLDPNYRVIASAIEHVMGLKQRSLFALPMYGDSLNSRTADKITESQEDLRSKAPKKPEGRSQPRDNTGKFESVCKNPGNVLENHDSPQEAMSPKSLDKQDPDGTLPGEVCTPTRDLESIPSSADGSVEVTTDEATPNHDDSGTPVRGIRKRRNYRLELTTPPRVLRPRRQCNTKPTEVKEPVKAKSADTPAVPKGTPRKAVTTCRITQLDKANCVWCGMGNSDDDEATHYKLVYDDKCPTAHHVGSYLFPDYNAARRACEALCERKPSENPVIIEGIPPIILTDLCAASRLVDEKMLSYISEDFIGGQRLITETVVKGYRSALIGLTRLLNILYFKNRNDAEIYGIFDDMIEHMKTIQWIDDARRNCEIGTTSANDLFASLTQMSPNYANTSRGAHDTLDLRQECRNKVLDVLKTLNNTVFMRLEPGVLPMAITKILGPKQQSDISSPGIELVRGYVICSGCMEFKVIETDADEDVGTSRKRVNYAQHYKTCRGCNARACDDCLSQLKSARVRAKANAVASAIPTEHGTADLYMSAATLLSQPLYPGISPPKSRSLQPIVEPDNTAPGRSPVVSMPLLARNQLVEPPGMGVITPMGGGPPLGPMVAPNMNRMCPDTSSPVRRMMPLPHVGSPLPMRNPNAPETHTTPIKQVMMPMCGSVPSMCAPVYNGPGSKTLTPVFNRNAIGSGPNTVKTAPMLKSPSVKNGPFGVALVSPSRCKDSPGPNGSSSRVPKAPAGSPEPTSGNAKSTFLCIRCEDLELDTNLPLLCCALCSRFDGIMVPISRESLSYYLNWTSEYGGYAYVHLICLDWLTYSKVVTPSLRKFPKTSMDHPCHYCGMACGAMMSCSHNYCSVKFHASCGAWLGCKADMGRKPDGLNATSRRAYCLRHTFLGMMRMSQLERKFMVASPHLYDLLVATRSHLATFYGGVYLSKHCVPNKMRNESLTRPALARPPVAGLASVKRPKIPPNATSFHLNNLGNTMSLLGNVNYMSLGLVLSKVTFGQPMTEYAMLPETTARDRLIQALNWTAYNGVNLVTGRRDKKEIRTIIYLIKAGQLKPIHGSKRGRKPKSLDGSNFDNRQKMPMEDILTYCHSGQLDSGEFFCPVCFSIYFERSPGLPGDDLHWIGCDGCERWFHLVCAGLWADGHVDANSPNWFCLACSRQRALNTK
ncbi:PHD-zinc-finger like domain family protein [Babesia bovis T2Bo]|uniref:PHD-finger family protein n=1 Tax=Babesia bovis TaxID=5865 RepID=A7AM35_BABBO|nr:PHD-zinc-finger like domain family protein [Babesia bovis T2Bo]EDO07619.1 PHD-zinc-finger like domain family protein [Babesia bovis T2Bo]|eukprot:XP_001611187.1 PHD-finger family protein [Babesia bovis T2Bo]